MKGFMGFRLLTCLLLLGGKSFCQQHKPGIDGMAPSKWTTIRLTQAPGRSYRTIDSQKKIYTQEDVYFKTWIPIVHNSKFSVAIGPQYRTEQLEFEDNGENSIHMLSHWNLRYAGVDLRSLIAIDSSSWLIFNANANKCGNFGDYRFSNFPLNYTFSSAFIKKESDNKEFGAGLIVNKSFTGITILPILIFHYNYSKKAGIEISIPYKVAWRYNASTSDIFYVKAEALNRSYFIRQENGDCSFRRIDVDMGVAYNKSFTKMMGVEAFVGYRQNVSNRLPTDVIGVKKSGIALSLEFYIRPPLKK